MKITIDINEKVIEEEVMHVIVHNAVEAIEDKLYHDEYGNYNRRVYSDAIKEAVRDAVKKNAEDIINRASEYAGTYIGKKGLKKMIDDGSI